MRAATVTAPDVPPVSADLPEPTGPPGSEPLRDPEALGWLRGAGVATVSPAQDGPDAVEQANTAHA